MGFFKKLFVTKTDEETPSASSSGQETSPRRVASAPETKPVSSSGKTDENVGTDATLPHTESEKIAPLPTDDEPTQTMRIERKELGTKIPKQKLQQKKDVPLPAHSLQVESRPVSSPQPAASGKNHTLPEPRNSHLQSGKKASPVPPAIPAPPAADLRVFREASQVVSNDKTPNDLPSESKERQKALDRSLKQRLDLNRDVDARSASTNKSRVSIIPQIIPVASGRTVPPRVAQTSVSPEVTQRSKPSPLPWSPTKTFPVPKKATQPQNPPPEALPTDLRGVIAALFEAAPESSETELKSIGNLLEDESKRDEIHKIFTEFTKDKGNVIRDFGAELSLGLTPTRWIYRCRESVKAIMHAATALKRASLADTLKQFDEQLERASLELGVSLSPTANIELGMTYEKLAKQMPESFDLGETPNLKESLLVGTLLSQVPGVEQNVIDKIKSASFGRYQTLCTIKADGIAEAIGIDLALADAIIQRFTEFRQARQEADPESRAAHTVHKLSELSEQLDRHHEAFCEADAHDDRDKKRIARQKRAATLREIDLLLVEAGQLALFQDLQRLTVEKRVRAIKNFLGKNALQLSVIGDGSPASKEAVR